MPKVFTEYNYGDWTVGLADDKDDVGMKYQDSDDQQVIHEKAVYSSLDDVIGHIKHEYGNRYESLVKNHGVFYTNDLAAEYPKEIKALGWDSAERRDRANAFCDEMSSHLDLDGNIVGIDPYEDREGLESLIEDMGKLYALQREGDMKLASEMNATEAYRVITDRVVDEGDSFDHYDFMDAFDSKEEAFNEIYEDVINPRGVEGIHTGLCNHFEEIYDEPSKHANMIVDYDAKHGSLDDVSNSKGKAVEAEFGGIKNSGAGLDVQKD